MQIIGISGFAGAGKTTVGDFFIREYGFTRLSFAGPLKDVVAALFGWDRQRLNGITPEDRAWREQPDPFWSERMGKPFTPRWALQYVGTNVCREHVHRDIWVERTAQTILSMGPDAKVIIDDVRFVNERAVLRRLGAHFLIMVRPQENGSYFPTAEHERLWKEGFGLGKHVDAYEAIIDRNNGLMPRPTLHSNILHRSEWEWLEDYNDNIPMIVNYGSYDQLYADIRSWYTETVLNTPSEVTTA